MQTCPQKMHHPHRFTHCPYQDTWNCIRQSFLQHKIGGLPNSTTNTPTGPPTRHHSPAARGRTQHHTRRKSEYMAFNRFICMSKTFAVAYTKWNAKKFGDHNQFHHNAISCLTRFSLTSRRDCMSCKYTRTVAMTYKRTPT